jgi:hypothetical protein
METRVKLILNNDIFGGKASVVKSGEVTSRPNTTSIVAASVRFVVKVTIHI